jgi:hypothetical protein
VADRLLCERDVLAMTSWPSRDYLNKRIRTHGFPRPSRRLPGIGDQWKESAIEEWTSGKPRAGAYPMMEKFAPGSGLQPSGSS